MISRSYKKILKFLAKSFNNIPWCVVGTTALALRGIDVNAKDIDILTSKEGARKMQDILKAFVVLAIEHSDNGLFCSYFGKFKIDTIDIEVMGDLKYFADDHWHSLASFLEYLDFILIDDKKIPILFLDDQLRIYQILGRQKDVDTIKTILKH